MPLLRHPALIDTLRPSTRSCLPERTQGFRGIDAESRSYWSEIATDWRRLVPPSSRRHTGRSEPLSYLLARRPYNVLARRET